MNILLNDFFEKHFNNQSIAFTQTMGIFNHGSLFFRNGTFTFIDYIGKLYAVTCHHCIEDLEDNELTSLIFPVIERNGYISTPKIKSISMSKDIDIAVFELDFNLFIKEDAKIKCISHFHFDDLNKNTINKEKDKIFIIGVPNDFKSTNIFETNVVIPTYKMYITSFETKVIEYKNNEIEVENVNGKYEVEIDGKYIKYNPNGLSGSPAYRYIKEQNKFLYVGMLQMFSQTANTLYILDIVKIEEFLDLVSSFPLDQDEYFRAATGEVLIKRFNDQTPSVKKVFSKNSSYDIPI